MSKAMNQSNSIFFPFFFLKKKLSQKIAREKRCTIQRWIKERGKKMAEGRLRERRAEKEKKEIRSHAIKKAERN